jgi:Domain of unknown function (DUF4249)
MKTSINILLVVIIIFSLIASCEKDVNNIKHPEFNLKLVISGFLSPDEKNHYISVYTNQAIYYDTTIDWNPGLIKGTLSDGSKEIQLRPIFWKYNLTGVPDSLVRSFVFTSSELSMEEGKTYTLKVESDKGLFAEASCTVPYKKNLFPELDTVRITNTNPYDNSKYTYLQSDFYFTDIMGEDNYYAFLSELTSYNSHNFPVSPDNRNLADPKYSCFNDKGIDGKRSKILSSQLSTNLSYYDSAFLKIYLLNTDKPYYDYHKSIEKYQSGEIPFTEASPIYSNVKGGLGIFAAYTYDSIVVRLK